MWDGDSIVCNLLHMRVKYCLDIRTYACTRDIFVWDWYRKRVRGREIEMKEIFLVHVGLLLRFHAHMQVLVH